MKYIDLNTLKQRKAITNRTLFYRVRETHMETIGMKDKRCVIQTNM